MTTTRAFPVLPGPVTADEVRRIVAEEIARAMPAILQAAATLIVRPALQEGSRAARDPDCSHNNDASKPPSGITHATDQQRPGYTAIAEP